MLIDFLALNSLNIYLASVLLIIFILNDKWIYYLLIVDIILNSVPIITILIIILYMVKNIVFSYFNDNFINKYILVIIYYFVFGIILYGIYNGVDKYLLKYLIDNLIINLIIYYLGIKYLMDEYNLVRVML